MNLESFEKRFQRAWANMTRQKLLLVFLCLSFSGLLIVFSRVVALTTGSWMALSLSFTPIFFVMGLLFCLGVFLIQVYQKEQSQKIVSYQQIMMSLKKSFVSVIAITAPVLVVCLFSWLILGLFFLIKEIPKVGNTVGVFLSFAPFLLILTTLLLVFFNIVLLFFVTPRLVVGSEIGINFWKSLLHSISKNPLTSAVNLFIGALPLLFILTFLVAAACLTQISYFASNGPLLVGLKWFFLMLPFNALMTPAIIFFFNFSSECYQSVVEVISPGQGSASPQ